MPTIRHYPFMFTGHGSEYFRIWIVNIALTVVTLGIYSAWAKVRTNRWFYGHTLLDSQPFSYLATPMQILKGRLIAIALLIAYLAADHFAPLFAGMMLIALGLFSPWIIILALRFNARHSAYRGIRFDFSGTVGEAAVVYLLLPLLSLITAGLALPYMGYRQVRFLASNYTYGTTLTRYDGTLKPFWSVYLIAMLLILIPAGFFVYGTLNVGQMAAAGADEETISNAMAGTFFVTLAIFYLTIPIMAGFVKARTANLFYNHTRLDIVGFRSNQRARDIIWIYITNFVLIVLTLGLFIPFALVRLSRYRAEHLKVLAADLDHFSAQVHDRSNAVGSEISDLFDMGIGIA